MANSVHIPRGITVFDEFLDRTAIWHLPYVLAGILHVDGIPMTWTALIAPIGIFGSGLVIGWLWLRTQSIWVVALAHGALNNWGQYAFKFTSSVGQTRDAVVLGAGSLALVALGSVLLIRQEGRLFERSASFVINAASR